MSLSPRGVHWIERLAWILIYGGLFAGITGYATAGRDPELGWGIVIAGGIAVLAGVALIALRARMPPGA